MKYIVNEEGEVLNEISEKGRIVVIDDGDRILKKNSILSYRRKKDNTSKVDYGFIKLNERYIREAGRDCSIFLTLLENLSYGDNLLMFPNGRYLNATKVASLSGVSYATCRRQINILLERDVIHKVKVGKQTLYYFNPYIATKGKYIDNDTLEMFKNSKYREVK